MNPEIARKMREIRRKCNQKQPDRYPVYCRRPTQDLLSLLTLILEDLDGSLTDNKEAIDDLTLVDGFVKLEDILA